MEIQLRIKEFMQYHGLIKINNYNLVFNQK